MAQIKIMCNIMKSDIAHPQKRVKMFSNVVGCVKLGNWQSILPSLLACFFFNVLFTMKQTKRFCCMCLCVIVTTDKIYNYLGSIFSLRQGRGYCFFPKNTHLEKQFVANNCPFGQDFFQSIAIK